MKVIDEAGNEVYLGGGLLNQMTPIDPAQANYELVQTLAGTSIKMLKNSDDCTWTIAGYYDNDAPLCSPWWVEMKSPEQIEKEDKEKERIDNIIDKYGLV